MAKIKESKSSSKAKSNVTPVLSKVKNSTVTKLSQSPAMKSKQTAKDVAAKTINGKRSKKAPTPSSDEESEGSDDESADSASSDDGSESEAEVTKLTTTTNGETNGKVNSNREVKSKEVDTSDSSDSSASDSEASDSDSSDDEKREEPAAAEESEDSDDSAESDAESEKADPVASVAKTDTKAAETGKSVENGAAKGIVKTHETSDGEDSDDAGSSDSDEEEKGDNSDDSSESESDDEAEEEEVPSKKRKADADPSASAKKSKTIDSNVSEETGSKNLFVGNLSWNVDDEWLYREFEEFGEITGARVISDRDSGRSKGFGYVEFAKASDATAALNAKKGALIDGREANVDFSVPRNTAAPKERANKRALSFGDSKNPESDTLFIGNISFEANEDMLGEAFSAHGKVVNIRLPTDMDSGNPKGFGYITFASVEDAKNAYENMMGAEVGGRPVRLDYATPRPERNGDSRGGRGGRGGGRGGARGRGGFGDRGGRGGNRGGRGGSTNRGGFGDFKGQRKTF